MVSEATTILIASSSTDPNPSIPLASLLHSDLTPNSEFKMSPFHEVVMSTGHESPPPESCKRPKGHPDAPTPPGSPQKKRPHTHGRDESDSTSNSSSHSRAPSPSPLPKQLSSKSNGRITMYFQIETAEEKATRLAKDWETLRRESAQNILQSERRALQREHQAKIANKARQQIHRDKKRDIRIANGWVPHQKRVSRAPSPCRLCLTYI